MNQVIRLRIDSLNCSQFSFVYKFTGLHNVKPVNLPCLFSEFCVEPVLLHDVLERSQKVFLKTEISQFSDLQELHGQLP